MEFKKVEQFQQLIVLSERSNINSVRENNFAQAES